MARALTSRLRWLLVAAVAFVPLSSSLPTSSAPPTPCAAIAAAEPQAGHNMPYAGPVLFASDFPQLTDCEWGFPLGGWGGVKHLSARKHVPVVFVHGNQADAENWFLVADQFRAAAGYTDQEMYALSYNGLGNAYAGMPVQAGAPSPESQAYWSANPMALCCSGGKGGSDDPNVLDLYNFIHAVQAYTGSAHVDIVAHSLGATVTRKMLMLHPELRPDLLAAVMIAGGNHGTTVCRGIDTSYYGCDEIAPGTPWLAALNAVGESPGPTRWMTVYNGTDNADPFFEQVPGVGDDRTSPRLEGALNKTYPGLYHNDLRVDPAPVADYLKFLLENGQDSVSSLPLLPIPVTGGLPNTSR